MIYDSIQYLYCKEDMRLVRYKKSLLGLNWRCVNKVCVHYKTTLSILHNSFSHHSAISPKKKFTIIYFLLKKTKQSNISRFVGVDQKKHIKNKEKNDCNDKAVV
ncbi:hypothetical protein DMUE_4916 [Dictyocoela muelleri]|nr:hypothetical protein DMUE_4916 [Dictyocoela muelleri]